MKWSIPEKVIERGRDYLKEGRVLSVTPDVANNVWHAEVLGSELYLVDLDATAKEEDFCQCPYWEEHGYCKHTVAVELYLRQAGKARRIKADDLDKPSAFSPSEMFSNGFSRLRNPEEKKLQPLSLQFVIDSIPTNPFHPELSLLGISVKLGYRGQTRSYVVKNIYRFLAAYLEEKKLLLNKQYSFQLGVGAFTPEENSLLQELAGLAQTQELIGQTGLPSKGKLDKKYLLLPVELGRDLLEKMAVVPTTLQFEEGKLSPVRFAKEGQPLAFSVRKKGEEFLLSVDQLFRQLFSHYRWGIAGESLYAMSAKQLEIYQTLEQLLKRLPDQVIPYPKSELSVLFKQVLPLLRELGEVTVSEEVYQYISEQPLKMKFVLRRKQGKIQVQLDFQYGETIFSTNPKQQQIPQDHPEIMRDYQKEERARHLLQRFGFTANDTGFAKEIPTGSQLFDFFTKEVPALQQLGEVLMGKKLRELYLDGASHTPRLTVDQEGSWLDVRFDISGIADQEIDAVLASLLRDDRFYTLENGQIITFDSEEFQQTSKALQGLRDQLSSQDGHLQLPLNQGLVLQERLTGENVDFTADFATMVQDLLKPDEFVTTLPDGLQAELRSYQVTGFRWLKMLSHYHFGGILADEMGLGKTLQAITYLLSEKQDSGRMQALIVAPASLTYNWQQELKRFAPQLTTAVIGGNRNERERLLAEPVDVFITSYASLRQDVVLYQDRPLTHLILDEAQMVKNSTTKTAHALRSLEIDHRFALSGTPIENNLEELWSLFQMIMPGFFPTRGKFKELTAEEVAKMIRPFILRRDKKSVLKDLPEKLERNYYSALTDEQKTIYLAYLRQMQEQITGMDSQAFRKNRIGILAGLTRLRQICCDPKLFIDDYEGSSGKLEQVKDLVQAANENGRRILLFSQFTGMLDIIEAELTAMGLTSFYLRGSTPPKERIKMVDEFNAGAKDVFLISLKAGGTGLNLTGADTVILYDLWWNPAVEEQAAGRAHRIGQKKVVEVWRLIAEGTIEERIDLLQNEKRELFQKVISGNETQIQQLTEEDIRMILNAGVE